MQFDESGVDLSGVEDRRGGGFGSGLGGGALVGGGGLGIVGLLAYLFFGVVGGGGGGGPTLGGTVPGSTSVNGAAASESREELQRRCNTEGALDRYTDCRIIKVYNVADEVWQDEFARRGVEYRPPRLAFFGRATNTGCGQASASTGPFYCPADERIYFDLDFLGQLQERFGAEGEFAQAYIVAHEFGHHIQRITGTEQRVRQLQQQNPAQHNAASVRLELQADCYAGVWSTLADRRGEDGIALREQDIAEAIDAAEAVGDDNIQRTTQGRVDPESWTHGSSQDRREWFLRGLRSADVTACNTFGGRG